MIRSLLKFLLIFALISLILSVGLILISPQLLPESAIKDMISENYKLNTGKTISVRGRVDVQLFPDVVLYMEDAHITDPQNPEWRQQVGSLSARVNAIDAILGISPWILTVSWMGHCFLLISVSRSSEICNITNPLLSI